MWLNKDGIANLISFDKLEKLYDISYHTKRTNQKFIVHTEKGDVEFHQDEMGLPYIDLTKSDAALFLAQTCMVQTVRGNFEGYTKRQIEEAKEAWKAVAMVGHPTGREFLSMVCSNMIQNCPIRPEAVTNAFKRVRTEYVVIPQKFMQMHKLVGLVANVMFVNGVPFLVTASWGLKLITIEHLPVQTTEPVLLHKPS